MKQLLYPLTALVLALGAGMFAYSLTLPYYTDEEAWGKLFGQSYEISQSEYYKQEAELRTNKRYFMDAGSGLAVAATAMLLFLALSRVKSCSDLRRLKTPGRTLLFVWSNFAWLLLIPAIAHYFEFRGKRCDYPPSADSIGIPIFYLSALVVVFILPLNLLIWLTTIKSDLPTKLLSKVNRYSITSILWEIFWGCLLLVSIAGFAYFVIDGFHGAIPVSMYFIYLVLCLRAGKVSYLNRRCVEQFKPKHNHL
jgi:hypothetical protein